MYQNSNISPPPYLPLRIQTYHMDFPYRRDLLNMFPASHMNLNPNPKKIMNLKILKYQKSIINLPPC